MARKPRHYGEKEYFRGPDEPTPVQKGTDTVAEAIARRRKVQAKVPEPQPLVEAPKTPEAGLEWEINMTATALTQFQRRMQAGEDINPEEMRVFLSLLNTMRQLKLAMQKMNEKEDDNMGPVEIALGLLETGMSKQEVLNLYPNNPKVKEALK